MTYLIQSFWTMVEYAGWSSVGFTMLGIFLLTSTGFLTAAHIWRRHRWYWFLLTALIFCLGSWIVMTETVLCFNYGYLMGLEKRTVPGSDFERKRLLPEWTFPEIKKYDL